MDDLALRYAPLRRGSERTSRTRVREAGKAFGPNIPQHSGGRTTMAASKALDVKRPKLHLRPSETRAPGLRQALCPKGKPPLCGGFMELAGLEPATSWVRSRRSPN